MSVRVLFSREMAQSARLPAASPPSLWIMGPWQDWLLFIGTPALILPLVSLAQTRVRLEDLVFFVASFGALGHHFPGLLRAYGDRELFARFKARFIVAPLFLVAVCVFCISLGFISGLTLVTYAWGVWHGLAQTYGFLRIYDGKVRSSATLTCRLDLAMCVAWFLGLVVLSPTRLHRVLELFYESGGPVVAAAWLQGARAVALAALVVVTLAFLVNLLVGWRRGQRPSPLKLVTMVTSFGFWWYAGIAVSNLLLGNLLFELFHDVQYLSIVWVFNRSRAAKGALSGLSRFLFRPRAALVAGYVGLVFAYGALNYVTNGMPGGLPQKVLQGALVASSLLHFYYDGFIWKLSDKATGQSLGLTGGREVSPAVRLQGLAHPLKWLLFLVPLGGLALAQTRGVAPDLERSRSFAQGIGAANDHSLLGRSLLAADDAPGAAASFRAALERDPAFAPARAGLGDALSMLGDRAAAEEAYRRALQGEDIATTRNSLGILMTVEGRAGAAAVEYRRALELDPGLHAARANLAGALSALGQVEEAREQLRMALKGCQDCPAFAPQYRNVARALYLAGRTEEALDELRKGVALKPDDPDLRLDLATVLAASGRPLDALEHFQASLLRRPEHVPSLLGQADALALLGRVDEAKNGYQKALSVQPASAEAHRNLGFLELHLGELVAAESSLRAALKLAPDERDAHGALAEVLRRRGRMQEAAMHQAAAAGPPQR